MQIVTLRGQESSCGHRLRVLCQCCYFVCEDARKSCLCCRVSLFTCQTVVCTATCWHWHTYSVLRESETVGDVGEKRRSRGEGKTRWGAECLHRLWKIKVAAYQSCFLTHGNTLTIKCAAVRASASIKWATCMCYPSPMGHLLPLNVSLWMERRRNCLSWNPI